MENKEYEKKIALVFDQINQNQSQKKSKKYDARYQYWPGKAFRMIPVTDYREYLNTALEAEAFIHQFQVEDTDGIYWAGYLGGDAISLSYGCGAAGIAYFYLELYKATGDERFKETVLKAGAYLCKHWRDPLNAPKTGRKIHSEYSYTSGVVGIAMSLFLFYETFHREEEKTALTEMADLIVANASEDQRGVFWDDDPTMAFDAGTTLFLFKAAEVLNRKDYLDTARKAADVILSSGVADERGGTAWDTKDGSFPMPTPQFRNGHRRYRLLPVGILRTYPGGKVPAGGQRSGKAPEGDFRSKREGIPDPLSGRTGYRTHLLCGRLPWAHWYREAVLSAV